jgi:hypothetical protein
MEYFRDEIVPAGVPVMLIRYDFESLVPPFLTIHRISIDNRNEIIQTQLIGFLSALERDIEEIAFLSQESAKEILTRLLEVGCGPVRGRFLTSQCLNPYLHLVITHC